MPLIEKPTQTRPPRENQPNPLFARGLLDDKSFAVTVGLLSLFIGISSWIIQKPLDAARAHLDVARALECYGLWFFISSCGFWMISTAFIKRWRAILEVEEFPRLLRRVIRFFLLSPLFSIWATVFSLLVNRWGPLRDGDSRGQIALVGVIWLVVFHVGFLMWSIKERQLVFHHGSIHLAKPNTPRDSLESLLGFDEEVGHFPTEKFYVHFFPYLNPGIKITYSVYSDFQRARWIYNRAVTQQAELCPKKLGFMGLIVDDCFFYSYRRAAEVSPFVSPALAVLFEARYRSRGHLSVPVSSLEALSLPSSGVSFGGAPSAASFGASASSTSGANADLGPIAQMAPALLIFDNILTVLEPSNMVIDRRDLISPRGFLTIFGSPEVVFLEFGQDAQRFGLAHKLVPLLQSQLIGLQASLANMRPFVSADLFGEVVTEVNELQSRLRRLHNDPLFLNAKKSENH